MVLVMVLTFKKIIMNIVTFLKNKISSFFADNISQAITESKLREVCNDMVDNFGTAVDITVTDLMNLINTSSMRPGMYHITDSVYVDGDIWVRAIDNKTLSLNAIGRFVNCDFQNLRAWNVGVWNSGLSGLMANISICIWNGFHYKNLTGYAGTAPDGDAVNWVYLPKTDSSYIVEYDYIEYELAFLVEALRLRVDKRGNRIMNSGQFQWGNYDVQGCSDEWGCSFVMLNNRGTVTGIELRGGATLFISERHEGYLYCSRFSGSSSISIDCPIGTFIYDWELISDEDMVISTNDSSYSRTISNTTSDVIKSNDITGSTSIGLTSDDKYIGLVNLTSSNSSESIESVGYIKEGRILRCKPHNGLIITFHHGVNIKMKGATNTNINGSNREWIDFQKIDGVVCEINRGQY